MSPRMRAPCMRVRGNELAAAGTALGGAAAACAMYDGAGVHECLRTWIAGRGGDGARMLRRLLALHEISMNVTRDFAAANGATAPSAGYAVPGKSYARDECLLLVHPSLDSAATALLPALRGAGDARAPEHRTLMLVNPMSVPDDESDTWCSAQSVAVAEVTHLYPDDPPRRRTRPTWVRIDALLFEPRAADPDAAFAVHSFNFSGAEAGAVHWAALLNAGHAE
jgi:hypothetical protein